MKYHYLFALPSLLLSVLAAPTKPNAENLHHLPLTHTSLPWDGKYFHEPGQSDSLGHYDIRYYNTPLPSSQRAETLSHLIQSYLSLFRDRNIETWIAHGTLLGWWWNGRVLPWDWDLDVQVSDTTLAWLGTNMNMTTHNYTFASADGSSVPKQYLLDINPFSEERVRGNGLNVIDARWIDMQTGLFVDITGLSETNPVAQKGVWSCKNYHRYRTTDLYPLRETEFEGVQALVPYNFERMLAEEYSNAALVKTSFEGHIWVPEQKEWVMQEGGRQGLDANGRAVPHTPLSLQADSRPRTGLKNLLRVFW